VSEFRTHHQHLCNNVTQIDKKASLKGLITDLRGVPISGAELKFYERNWYDAPSQIKLTKTIVSPENGEYLVENIPYGYYVVTIRAKGFTYSEISRVFVGGSETTFDIGLEVGKLTDYGPVEFSGVVKEENGKVLPDATVVLTSAFNSSIRFQTRTNEQGKYQFSITTEGQFILQASKSGYEVSATSASGFSVTKNFTLNKLK
jgi:Carboxypeptidase regulatory-like domain